MPLTDDCDVEALEVEQLGQEHRVLVGGPAGAPSRGASDASGRRGAVGSCSLPDADPDTLLGRQPRCPRLFIAR